VTLTTTIRTRDPIHVALVKGPTGGTLQLNSSGILHLHADGRLLRHGYIHYVVDDGNAVGNTATSPWSSAT